MRGLQHCQGLTLRHHTATAVASSQCIAEFTLTSTCPDLPFHKVPTIDAVRLETRVIASLVLVRGVITQPGLLHILQPASKRRVTIWRQILKRLIKGFEGPRRIAPNLAHVIGIDRFKCVYGTRIEIHGTDVFAAIFFNWRRKPLTVNQDSACNDPARVLKKYDRAGRRV